MKTSPRLERPVPMPRLDNFGRTSSESFPISAIIKSRFFSAPKLWPADERHVRRPGWTELFYDLVFAGRDQSIEHAARSRLFASWRGALRFFIGAGFSRLARLHKLAVDDSDSCWAF